MKLDIGTIEKREGYTTVDLREGADIVADAKNLPLKECSVEEIVSNHMIEHVTRYEGKECLKEWHRVLQDKGALYISTPDIHRMMQYYIDNDKEFWNPIRFEGETITEQFNNLFRGFKGSHKYIWEEQELIDVLEKLSFKVEKKEPDEIYGKRDMNKRISILLRAIKHA